MAPAASVQTAEAERTCPDCGRTIPAARRFCDRDRDRRRALTFLEQTWRTLDRAESCPAFDAATHYVERAMEEIRR